MLKYILFIHQQKFKLSYHNIVRKYGGRKEIKHITNQNAQKREGTRVLLGLHYEIKSCND